MPAREKQMSGGFAPGRGLPRALLFALFCAAMLAGEVRQAAAFEIFGIKLWGSSKDEDADIVDPLRYSVTLNAPDADKDLVKRLENASALKNDEDHPVSGSLGLMAKARGDREQLVAALYADARYEGVVTITIEGKSIDELPPDAEFKGPQPIPVVVSVAPGAKFTLGNIRL
ncbi:MAG: outer membrane protein assembly factor, partial [Mesorhizobium sp.]